MAADARWRTNLWRYLGARIGEPVRVGELMELFADTIPLHHATRIWQNHSSRLDGPIRMRRACLTSTLRGYELDWQPALGRGRRIADSDIIIPLGRPCGYCGKPYFAQRETLHCGRSCARKHGFRDRGEHGRYTARMAA
jgi:hypothetical protein